MGRRAPPPHPAAHRSGLTPGRAAAPRGREGRLVSEGSSPNEPVVARIAPSTDAARASASRRPIPSSATVAAMGRLRPVTVRERANGDPRADTPPTPWARSRERDFWRSRPACSGGRGTCARLPGGRGAHLRRIAYAIPTATSGTSSGSERTASCTASGSRGRTTRSGTASRASCARPLLALRPGGAARGVRRAGGPTDPTASAASRSPAGQSRPQRERRQRRPRPGARRAPRPHGGR